MKIKVFKSALSGRVILPHSKSYVQRLIAAAVLSRKRTCIKGTGDSEDVKVSVRAAEKLGKKIEKSNEGICFHDSNIFPQFSKINLNETGFAARTLPTVASVRGGEFIFKGCQVLRKRDVYSEIKQLEKFGVKTEELNDRSLFKIAGQLKNAKTNICASKSSQFLSGLLFSLPLCSGNSELSADSIVSRPYIDLSIDILKNLGIDIQQNNNNFFIPGNQHYREFSVSPESDWSAAAVIISLATLTGNIKIENINSDSKQADKNIIALSEQSGIDYSIENNKILINKSEFSAFTLDLNDNPDLFPVVIPLALQAKSKSRIINTKRLRNKESDRLNAVLSEYKKMGAKFETKSNELIIKPGNLEYAEIDSHNDHRIAMSLTVAALSNKGALISGVESVNKSWPEFFKTIKNLGGKIDEYLR